MNTFHMQVALFVTLTFAPVGTAIAMGDGSQAIDIGNRKQLFLDDSLIESHHNVAFTMNPPRRTGEILSGVSRAVMRLDGFISVDAPYQGAELITKPLQFRGKRLQLNVDTGAGGSIRVELLDANGDPLEGFSGKEAPFLLGNSVRLPVTWKSKTDLASLARKPIRIRFSMRDCKLYAFRFVD